MYSISYLILLLNHILLSTDVITGDNLVDRSVDLCKKAFLLIPYDPMQGTHPALGVVDHVSTLPIYTHHYYDICIQNITQYLKYNSLLFHAIYHLNFLNSSSDLIPCSLKFIIISYQLFIFICPYFNLTSDFICSYWSIIFSI